MFISLLFLPIYRSYTINHTIICSRVNLLVTKRFWKYAAALSRTKLQELWLDSDQDQLLLAHLDHQDILDLKETRVPLVSLMGDYWGYKQHTIYNIIDNHISILKDDLDLLDRMASKGNLDYKGRMESLELKVPLEAKVTVELLSLEHLAKLVSQDLLVSDGLSNSVLI